MKRTGFTLIELLVVIAIIGLLTVLSVIALGNARQKANDAKRLSDIGQIQTALEWYFTDNNKYPGPHENATLGNGNYICLNREGFAASGCQDAYMPVVPKDPRGSYTYNSADGTSYTLTATLEAGAGSFKPGQIKATPSGMTQ